jgi:hypothetical protein
MGNIVLKINPKLADRLADRSAPDVAELHKALAVSGATLGAPTGTVGESRQYFSVTGVEPQRVDEMLDRLRNVSGVEAAYVKPSDEPP